jgi:hypothetical protein
MKKYVFFFVSLWIVSLGVSAQGYHYDVNNDGSVNITDATLVVSKILRGDNNGIKAIDLGLPSGLKWASCNVGASCPEEYGDYFAWGEIGTKKIYDEDTYLFHKLAVENDVYFYPSLGDSISATTYDVARMKWGDNWRMPTWNEFRELMDENNCTSKPTTLNGVNCIKFTSKVTGNSIFLPISGIFSSGTILNAGISGFYMSSSPDPSRSANFYGLGIYSNKSLYWGTSFRYFGYSVRPVTE